MRPPLVRNRPQPSARHGMTGTDRISPAPARWASESRPRDRGGGPAAGACPPPSGQSGRGGRRRPRSAWRGGRMVRQGPDRAVRGGAMAAANGGRRAVGDEFDVVVVGAGPAGAAAALAARRAGASVLLLDRADFPRDKACGDGIAAHAVDVLAELGVTERGGRVRAAAGAAAGRRRAARRWPGRCPDPRTRCPGRSSTPGWWRPRWRPAPSCAGTRCARSRRAPTGWCSTGAVRPGGGRRGRRRVGRPAGARPPAEPRPAPGAGHPGVRPGPARPARAAHRHLEARAGRRTPGRFRSVTDGRTSGTGRCCAVSR